MEQASSTLQRIMAQTLERLPAEQLPQAVWDFAAGRAVAEKTRVLAFENRVLLIEVPDATWRAQLGAMALQFLARLNQVTRVEGIDFQLAGAREPERAAAPRRERW
jgi:predicted nucleic acid-binding Zn ribbon protein